MNKKILSIAAAAAIIITSSGYAVNIYASNADTTADSTTSVTSEKKPSSVAEIQNKMLNSIDNYKSAKGSYRIIEKTIATDNTVEFEVQGVTAGEVGSYVKTTGNKNGAVVHHRYDGADLLVADEKTKSFKKLKVAQAIDVDKSKPRSFKDNNNEWNYVYRADPAVADPASDVVFPQVYAFWLNEGSGAKVTGQENLLGRSVTIVEGNLDSTLAERHQAQSFKLWIDSETGVLLKLEEKNAKNELINSIVVSSIEFNKTVDRTKFAPTAPSQFTEIVKKKDQTTVSEPKK